jgi:hypothetical protein
MIEDRVEVTGAPFASIAVKIGAPVEQKFGEHGCDVELGAGDRREKTRIFGEGSLQALLLALRFAADRIEDLVYRAGGEVDGVVWKDLARLRLTPEEREELNTRTQTD